MIVLLFLAAQTDTIPADTFNLINYRAKQITFDLEKSIVILNDSAVITYQDIILHSDSAYYFVEPNQLHAFGQCRLYQLDDSIMGSFLKYNIDAKKALMKDGTTQIDKGYIAGREIFWISDKTINVFRGTYTTCSDSPPHYYFYSPKMKVYLGDMVIARPIYLYIYGLPVLAAPFWFVPISARRKSGLLPFKAGSSSQYGKYLRGFAYYQVVSDYSDVTLQIDAYEKKGIMPQVEGVWDYSPFSAGSILGSYIRETDLGHVRYSIAGRNSSPYFLFGSDFNCDFKYQSDNRLRSDYADTTTVWLEQELVSTATINRRIVDFGNTLSAERRVVFTGDSVIERFPHYTLAMPTHSLFSRLGYSLSAHANRDRTSAGDSSVEASGVNLHVSPAAQQNVAGLFTLSPGADFDYAVFDADSAGKKFPTRFGYSFWCGANTILYRRLPVEMLGVHGILHKVTPSVRYSITPDFRFHGLPPVWGIPQYAHAENIDFAVSQDLEAKVGADSAKKNLLRINLGSGYNRITDSLKTLNFTVDLPFNPFPKPIAGFTNRAEGFYDIYRRDYFYKIASNITVRTDFFSLSLNQSYDKTIGYQCWFSGELIPSRHWLVGYSLRYDRATNRFVDYSLALTRNLHCWEGVFNFSQLDRDWRYDFKVRIKEIPEIQIGRGLLGYLVD